MSRTIHRFEVRVDNSEHSIQMHPGAITRVDVGYSVNVVEFWAEQRLDDPKVEGLFLVVGTGHPVPDGWTIAGTTRRIDGLVWHLLAQWRELDSAGDPS